MAATTMFTTPRPSETVYGSYRAADCRGKWTSGQRLPCGTVLVQSGAHPACPVIMQIWVANQSNSAKTVAREFECTFSKEGELQKSGGNYQHFLAELLSTTYDDETFSDVVLKAGQTRVRAHKHILAAQSPSFMAMFQSGMREQAAGEIELGQLEGPILTVLVSFMYGKLLVIPADIVLDLFMAADAHQVITLRSLCLQQLIASITPDTIFDYVQTADSCSESSLLEACLEDVMLPENSLEVVQQPEMQRMVQNNPDLAHRMMVAIATQKRAKK